MEGLGFGLVSRSLTSKTNLGLGLGLVSRSLTSKTYLGLGLGLVSRSLTFHQIEEALRADRGPVRVHLDADRSLGGGADHHRQRGVAAALRLQLGLFHGPEAGDVCLLLVAERGAGCGGLSARGERAAREADSPSCSAPASRRNSSDGAAAVDWIVASKRSRVTRRLTICKEAGHGCFFGRRLALVEVAKPTLS